MLRLTKTQQSELADFYAALPEDVQCLAVGDSGVGDVEVGEVFKLQQRADVRDRSGYELKA